MHIEQNELLVAIKSTLKTNWIFPSYVSDNDVVRLNLRVIFWSDLAKNGATKVNKSKN